VLCFMGRNLRLLYEDFCKKRLPMTRSFNRWGNFPFLLQSEGLTFTRHNSPRFFLWGYIKDAVYVPPSDIILPEIAERIGAAATSVTRMYPKVSGLSAWSDNCKWYTSLPLGAVVSLFCDSQSSEFCRHNPLCCFSTSVYCCFCCCCLFRY